MVDAVFTARQAALADAIADVVLEHGLDALALRGLAVRLSTSGRMLLYYFGTKEALVVGVLARVSARMGLVLAGFESGPPVTPGAFLGSVLAMAQAPGIAPFMRVWTETVARGARGEQPYAAVAAAAVGDWLAWIESRLLPGPRAPGMAAAILSIVEGVTLLEQARPGTTAQARLLLPDMLDRGIPLDGRVGPSDDAAAR